jgi:excisionase family DNA binding protein
MPEVLTLSEAAAYLRLREAEVLRLTREQDLPAQQVGSEWRFLLAAIRDLLSKGKPPKSNKEAWMELVGMWKDDPTLDELLEEIKRQRERLNSEVAG